MILWVDDDESFALLLPRLMKKAGVDVSLQFVHSGRQALEYLNGDGQFSDRNRFPFPSLLMLDLKMPGVDGFDVLQWRKQRSDLKNLPVVVCSSSDMSEDVLKSLSLGADSYIVKPAHFDKYVGIIKKLEWYWKSPPPPIEKAA